MGRLPKEFDEEYWIEGEGLNKIREWLEQGLTDKKICENIGISQYLFIEWKKRHEKFLMVYKKAKNVIMNDLENAMYRSATGYFVEEDALDRNGNVVSVKRYISPAPQTQIWLSKNWDSEHYKDKRDMAIEGAIPVVLSGEDKLED